MSRVGLLSTLVLISITSYLVRNRTSLSSSHLSFAPVPETWLPRPIRLCRPHSRSTVRSTATQTELCGGFLWLKPVVVSLVSCSKAEVVMSGSETMLVYGWKQMVVDG